MKKWKIFIGFDEIAGYNASLTHGFEELGYKCVFIDKSVHPFRYTKEAIKNPIIRLLRYANNNRNHHPSGLLRGVYTMIIGIVNTILLLWALLNFNVFIFFYGKTFLNCLDLPILKLFRKKIIFVFLGSDSRPPFIDGCVMGPGKQTDIYQCIRLSAFQKQRIRIIEKYADFIIDNSASGHFHEREFIQVLCMGIPFVMPNIPKSCTDHTAEVKILHSPSDPIAKGTEIIRLAVRKLMTEGYPVSYKEVINQPHEIVLREIGESDIIIDQCYSDTPMATFATEAAWFGKAALVGGYYSSQIDADLAGTFIPPSCYCHPDKIYESLHLLATDRVYREDLGKKAQTFVQSRWTSGIVASRYIQLLENSIPDEWRYDPKRISYLHGAGMSEIRLKEVVRDMIRIGGIKALHLDDKPSLERLYEKLALE